MKKNEITPENYAKSSFNVGHAFVMTHSLFSDVVQIGCSVEDPKQFAKSLSEKTIGEYSVAFSLECNEPCKVKSKIKEYLNAQRYSGEFYQISPEFVAKLLQRETLKIPSLNVA